MCTMGALYFIFNYVHSSAFGRVEKEFHILANFWTKKRKRRRGNEEIERRAIVPYDWNLNVSIICSEDDIVYSQILSFSATRLTKNFQRKEEMVGLIKYLANIYPLMFTTVTIDTEDSLLDHIVQLMKKLFGFQNTFFLIWILYYGKRRKKVPYT